MDLLTELTSRIHWTAWGVIATFTAVFVALLPIFRVEKRRKAEARMLRARLVAELGKVHPTFQAIALGNEQVKLPPEVLNQKLDPKEVIESLEKAGPLTDRSYVLEHEEQDLVAKITSNASLFAAVYGKCGESLPKAVLGTAQNLADWIEELEKLFRKNGYYVAR